MRCRRSEFITEQILQELSSKGYTVISALSPDEVQRLRDEIDHVFETITTDESIQEHEMFRHGMLNKSELCQQTIAHPAIRNVVMPLLGADYHVIANTAWRQIPPTKNERGQLWHCDGGPHIPLPDGSQRKSNPMICCMTSVITSRCCVA